MIYLRQIQNLLGNIVPCQEVHKLFRKIVAVMRKEIIRLTCKARTIIIDEVINQLFRKLRISHRKNFNRRHPKSRFNLLVY